MIWISIIHNVNSTWNSTLCFNNNNIYNICIYVTYVVTVLERLCSIKIQQFWKFRFAQNIFAPRHKLFYCKQNAPVLEVFHCINVLHQRINPSTYQPINPRPSTPSTLDPRQQQRYGNVAWKYFLFLKKVKSCKTSRGESNYLIQ